MNNGFARAIWVRQDWLEKAGLSIPKGPQEYKEMPKALKAQDPGGVGDALYLEGLLGEFILHKDESLIRQKTGK